jgi:tetratricopeptide (TPR) repeat protein
MAGRALAELLALNALDPSNVDYVGEIVSMQAFLANLLVDRGDIAGAREQLRQATAREATLMARHTPKRAWRITHQGRIAEARGRLATTDTERAAARTDLAAYMADVRRYETEGGVVPQFDAVTIASAGLVQGDLLARAGLAAQAHDAWQSAANRIRLLAERSFSPAMTQLGQLDLRLGDIQDARAWADKVVATSYRHPAFIDLQQRLGPAPLAGEVARP